MKIVIIIPAYNEEKTIGKVIKEIPKNILGLDQIRVIVIDDGSDDKTIKKAESAGVDYIIKNRTNRGLALAFKKGLEEALFKGANIIVNIDADYQYNSKEIPKLVEPILEDKADMVIGDRQVRKLKHMSFIKKYGNILLSWTMRVVLKNKVNDASSGFRAFNRKCASKIKISSNYTYTLESIIQAVLQGIRIEEVPIVFREREEGESRLIKSLFKHITFSISTIIRTYRQYRPRQSSKNS
jgi:glycosyltransferase involved in cell wall biosynthesis